MKIVTVMGRTFDIDDQGMLVTLDGSSTRYRLSDCFLKHNHQEGKQLFSDSQIDDWVVFHGEESEGISGHVHHVTYLLMRNHRVIEIRRPFDQICWD